MPSIGAEPVLIILALASPTEGVSPVEKKKIYNKAKEEIGEAGNFFTHNPEMFRTLEVIVNGVGPPRSLIRQSGSSFSGLRIERQRASQVICK